jgi:predicted phosphate transport protein (TIGR00153 family)
MALSSFVKLFMPKDRVFYGLFEEVSATLVQMGEVFKTAAAEADYARRDALLKSLEELEHKNDETTHKIFIELGSNFITPFDREDIHFLATALDDVADYIWGSAKRMVNYDIMDHDQITVGFAEIIMRSIKELHRAVHELRNMKDLRSITEACVKINSLENEGDELLDKAMISLFSSSNNPIEVIKKKDLYQMLEIVTDKCEDAANVIESIIIKYS